MAKNKISEFSSTAANNTDIGNINIAEGCAPSGINNAIRELMAQLKDQQTGADGDGFIVGGGFTCTGAAVFSSTVAISGAATAPTPSVTDDTTKVATTAFVRDIVPTGVIVMWSGSIASIPSGWLLCDGTNSTPDLRNRFIVGAGSTYSVAGTGGSADAIVVSHTHTGTTASNGDHFHDYPKGGASSGPRNAVSIDTNQNSDFNQSTNLTTTRGTDIKGAHTHTFTTDSAGSSGTNANLPPYYALAYIMKS
jgi:hypothetical protein